jgi:hypothetical protein
MKGATKSHRGDSLASPFSPRNVYVGEGIVLADLWQSL